MTCPDQRICQPRAYCLQSLVGKKQQHMFEAAAYKVKSSRRQTNQLSKQPQVQKHIFEAVVYNVRSSTRQTNQLSKRQV